MDMWVQYVIINIELILFIICQNNDLMVFFVFCMISNNFEARVTMVMDTIMFMIFLLCFFFSK